MVAATVFWKQHGTMLDERLYGTLCSPTGTLRKSHAFVVDLKGLRMADLILVASALCGKVG
jgi:hypothetical protein